MKFTEEEKEILRSLLDHELDFYEDKNDSSDIEYIRSLRLLMKKLK